MGTFCPESAILANHESLKTNPFFMFHWSCMCTALVFECPLPSSYSQGMTWPGYFKYHVELSYQGKMIYSLNNLHINQSFILYIYTCRHLENLTTRAAHEWQRCWGGGRNLFFRLDIILVKNLKTHPKHVILIFHHLSSKIYDHHQKYTFFPVLDSFVP